MTSDFAKRERKRRQARLDKWHASLLLDRRANPTPDYLYVQLAFARSADDLSEIVRSARRRTALLVSELRRGRKTPATLPSLDGALELIGIDRSGRLTCLDEAAFEGESLTVVAPDPEDPVWDAVPDNATVRGGQVWAEDLLASAPTHPHATALLERIEARRTRFRWLALIKHRATLKSVWAFGGAKRLALARAGLIDVFEQSEAPLETLGLTPGILRRVEAALDQFLGGGRTLGRLPSAWVLKSQKGIGKAAVKQIADAMLARAEALYGEWPEATRAVDPALDDGLGALADLFE